jgi:hypothetical protein
MKARIVIAMSLTEFNLFVVMPLIAFCELKCDAI